MGVRICTARVTDDSFLATTKTVTVIVYPPEGGPVPQPPVAIAGAWPLEGDAPFETTLVCNNSYDPDGQIVKYEWDFEGDGQFDWQSGNSENIKHTYGAGIWNAVLRVTDNSGLIALKNLILVSNSSSLYWQRELVQQLQGSSQLKTDILETGIGAAVSPVTGELCIVYGVRDDIMPNSTKDRIRMAFKGGSGGNEWRFEDYFAEPVPPPGFQPSVGYPTRPAFFADGTMVVGTYLTTDGQFRQAILIERDPSGEISVYNMGGMNNMYFLRDWLAVSTGSIQPAVGFLYRNGEYGRQYSFAERKGESLTEQDPFQQPSERQLFISHIDYVINIPVILQIRDFISLFSRQEGEFQEELVTVNPPTRVCMIMQQDNISIQYAAQDQDNVISRLASENGSWENSPFLLRDYPLLQAVRKALFIDQGFVYIASFYYESDNLTRNVFLLEDGTSYFSEPLDETGAYLTSIDMALDDSGVYVAAADESASAVYLYTRESPL
ncbi:MAG: PKD domain-containing protein [bacterium]